jgi:hypothetical protein
MIRPRDSAHRSLGAPLTLQPPTALIVAPTPGVAASPIGKGQRVFGSVGRPMSTSRSTRSGMRQRVPQGPHPAARVADPRCSVQLTDVEQTVQPCRRGLAKAMPWRVNRVAQPGPGRSGTSTRTPSSSYSTGRKSPAEFPVPWRSTIGSPSPLLQKMDPTAGTQAD